MRKRFGLRKAIGLSILTLGLLVGSFTSAAYLRGGSASAITPNTRLVSRQIVTDGFVGIEAFGGDYPAPSGLSQLSGRNARSRFNFDTYVIFENNSARTGCPPETAAVFLTLFDDETDTPLTTTSFTLAPTGPSRVQSTSLSNLVDGAGGFSAVSTRSVSGSVNISASNPDIVGISVRPTRAQTGPVAIQDTQAFATCP